MSNLLFQLKEKLNFALQNIFLENHSFLKYK